MMKKRERFQGMNSSSSKVIKSEVVKFIQTPAGNMSSSSRNLEDQSLFAEDSDQRKCKDTLREKIKFIEQASYEKGFSDGIQKGKELQRNETMQTLQTMTRVIEEALKLKKNILENMEQQIIQLSLAIAEKVIHLEVTTNREVIRNVLKEAIKKIGDRENMKIRIHPQDLHFMSEIKADFLRDFDGIKISFSKRMYRF